MNGAELNRFARLLKLKNWGGIFYANKIPKTLKLKTVYVINCCPAGGSSNGHHWICVYAKSGRTLELFDSSGLHPRQIKNFKIPDNYREIDFNGRRLQGYKSSTCGLYCLFYAQLRSESVKNWNFLEYFGKNLTKNDSLICEWAQGKFKKFAK